MEKKYTYDYPMTAITADVVAYRYDKDTEKMQILLIKRKNDPYKGKWALPGGFVDPDEKAENAARRELEEETGLLASPYSIDFQEYRDDPDRDPRNRTISFVFNVQIAQEEKIKAGDDAVEAKWFDLWEIEEDILAFDHADILENFLWGNMK